MHKIYNLIIIIINFEQLFNYLILLDGKKCLNKNDPRDGSPTTIYAIIPVIVVVRNTHPFVSSCLLLQLSCSSEANILV